MDRTPIGLLLAGLLLVPFPISAQPSTLKSGVKISSCLALDQAERAAQAEQTAQTDSTATIRPGAAMLRSAIFPGWGQFYTGHPFKAAWMAAAGATFLTLTVRADSRISDLADRRSPLLDPTERAALEADIEAWRVERRRWLVWTATIWIYAVVDAYVDAHLHDFEAEEPRFRLTLGGLGKRSLAPLLGLRVNLGRKR